MDKKETTRLLDSLIKYNRVDINNMKGQFPELGDAFMNVILAIDQEYGSGNIDRTLLRTPNATTLPIQVGDYITSPTWNSTSWVKITKLDMPEGLGIDESGRIWQRDIEDIIDGFNNNLLVKIPDPTALKPSYVIGDRFTSPLWKDEDFIIIYDIDNYKVYYQDEKNYQREDSKQNFENNITNGIYIKTVINNNLTYKVGDYFTGKNFVYAKWIKITEILKDKILGIRDDNTSYDLGINSFNENIDSGEFYIIPDPTLNNQVSFKLGDLFTVKGYSQDIYVINEMGSDKVGIRNTTNNNITRAGYPNTEKSFKSGDYILLPPTQVKNPNISIGLTGWTKDWKANKLRPSPTRKASLEDIGVSGMGNDGNVYEVVADKNGTKKWKKTTYNVFGNATRKDFSELYDLQLLYDQLVYENSQLYPTDLDYEENQKLITKLVEEIKTK
jgi:hypothetical protein